MTVRIRGSVVAILNLNLASLFSPPNQKKVRFVSEENIFLHFFGLPGQPGGVFQTNRQCRIGEDAPRPYLENLIVPEIKTNKRRPPITRSSSMVGV
jgi:hypothetical protein